MSKLERFILFLRVRRGSTGPIGVDRPLGGASDRCDRRELDKPTVRASQLHNEDVLFLFE